MTSSFAAGCWTSSWFRIAAASLVTESFSRWLMTILLSPLGPYAEATLCESWTQASMLRNNASSTPWKCREPSLSI
uniref:Putative secreted protein n=1 Tax=Ixodes ricinus TaxID=34613 RepID=A0A6B0U472_IXORI